MNILLDALPTTINIDGEAIPVKTDFRYWIRFTEIVQEYDLESITIDEYVEMMQKVISTIFYDEQKIEITITLFSEITEFYTGFSKGKQSKKNSEKKVFDFVVDADEIYSSFLQEYGIRLIHEKMHWYEFRTLFSGLSQDSAIGRLIHIRTMTDEDVPKDKIAKLHELQEEVKLPSFGSYLKDEIAIKNLWEKLK